MNRLKKFFPYSFNAKSSVGQLAITVIVYLIVGAIAGALVALLSHLPFIGWIIGILGSLVNVYVFVGILLSVLDYFKLLK